jgi:predicted DNA-binding transcriptional regulator AlpA
MTPELKSMLVSGFRPPWQDREVLALCLGVVDNTLEAWVAQSVIPAPRKRGGKLLWKWSEVDEWLTVGKAGGPADKAEEIRNGTRAAAAAARH